MHKKYHILYLLVFLIVSFEPAAFAQRQKVRNLSDYDLAPYHFGFILGMNQMLFSMDIADNFQFKNYEPLQTPDIYSDSTNIYGIEHQPAYGFTIGIVSNLRLSEQLDLRFVPSLSFGERNIDYMLYTKFEGERKIINISKKIQSTFVEFPLHIKYKGSRMNNIRPYWLAGAKYALDLASDSKKKEENNNVYLALKQNDLYAELGAGFDFYTTFFKFGIELKMSYGLTDILRREGNIYTGGFDKLRSKLFLLSFTFE
ncbi:MAG: outer membrane beta-barrel protein [Lentimicrobiaceae bacterium]|nr:outer membrane beta-barrel protein [Lentimicrobiaceae bacterium]